MPQRKILFNQAEIRIVIGISPVQQFLPAAAETAHFALQSLLSVHISLIQSSGSGFIVHKFRRRIINHAASGLPDPQAVVHIIQSYHELLIHTSGLPVNSGRSHQAGACHGGIIHSGNHPVSVTGNAARLSDKAVSGKSAVPDNHPAVLDRAVLVI